MGPPGGETCALVTRDHSPGHLCIVRMSYISFAND